MAVALAAMQISATAFAPPCAPSLRQPSVRLPGRLPPLVMSDEPKRPAGRLSVPWTVLLVPLIFPLTFFGEERWAAMKQMPVAGPFFRVMSNGVFDSEAVVDGAGTPYEVAFVPTAGIAVFIGYQLLVQLYQRTTGQAPSFKVDIPSIDLGAPGAVEREAEDAEPQAGSATDEREER